MDNFVRASTWPSRDEEYVITGFSEEIRIALFPHALGYQDISICNKQPGLQDTTGWLYQHTNLSLCFTFL
jgi:hypothetical protein